MKKSISLTACAALALMFTGCGGSGTVPVAGKVVYSDGSPATDLAGYLVNLDSSELKVSANGAVQPDGTFKVGTYDVEDGALPGKYKVAITPPEAPIDAPPPKPIISPKYGDLNNSGLEAEIGSDPANLTLQVERLKN
jgi:hypothetical protein